MGETSVEKDVTYNFDKDFSAQLSINESTVQTGQILNLYGSGGELVVKDSNGNKIISVRDKDPWSSMNGHLIFKNDNETIKAPIQGSLGWPHVTIPDIEGAFTVYYQLNDASGAPIDTPDPGKDDKEDQDENNRQAEIDSLNWNLFDSRKDIVANKNWTISFNKAVKWS
jgi:hypothetical protein